MGEVLVIITGDTYCHDQGHFSAVYYLVRIHHRKVGCLLIDNGDKNLVIYLKDRLVPGHSE